MPRVGKPVHTYFPLMKEDKIIDLAIAPYSRDMEPNHLPSKGAFPNEGKY